MAVTTLWITDFRCFEEAAFEPDPDGLTVLQGPNGVGKTSVLEAIGWLAEQRSFRGAGREALVRRGRHRAVLRVETLLGERKGLVEAELPVDGPSRIQLNRQLVRRRAQLTEALRVSVFSPDDLAIVQGGPAGRRQYLDETLSGRHARYDALVEEVERILRQRGALLRQASADRRNDVLSTLDVWDDRLASAGEALAEARRELIADLTPLVRGAYRSLAGDDVDEGAAECGPSLEYRQSWSGPLHDALAASRQEDLHRQVNTVGPHRDELEISLGPRPARTQASQGEQRSVALALRLATHHLATSEQGRPPVLLLDDVFSELDARRAAALVSQLPAGQVLLTTAVDPPPVVSATRVVVLSGARAAEVGRAR
jgi:DNA replication and repair protein RecF